MSNLSNTQSQVLPHTHDESEITWLSTDLQWKQDKLVAWSNISIAADGKTISATDTKYSAWTNVTIDANNKISATDTTYNDATQSAHWLMSAADKLKLDGIEPWAWVAKVSWVKWDAESSYREWLVNITKANIGLWNVDNTSDANKPVSTAMQTALDLKQDISSMPTDLWDFTNNAWFIKNTVNDLTNYYKKTETYTQTEINNLINSFWGFQVVSTLPTSDIKTNIIYLLWPIWTWADKYEEWIYTTTWVKIGETSVDLTNYVTTNTAQTISWIKTFSAEPVLPAKTTAAWANSTKPATEYQVSLKANTSDVLTKTNTTSFTPTWDYNPATKKYVDDKHSTIQVTLSSSNWSSKTQTVTATWVTASNTVIVSPDPTNFDEYSSNVVYCYSQASNSLTFKCTTTPSSNITVNVVILN